MRTLYSSRAVSGPTRRAFIGRTVAAALPMLAAPAIVRAQAVQLTLSSWLGPQSMIRDPLFTTWMEQVAAVTDGRVQVAYLDAPLGPPPAHLDLVRSGATDVAYSLHGYSGDAAFLRARVGQFSFLGDAYTASHAYSGVYTNQLDAVREHDGIKLLGVFQHGPGQIMLADKVIDRPGDFEGLRIRTSGGYISRLIEAMGGVAVPASPTDIAAKLDSGEIDGCCLPYEGALAFGLMDKIRFISDLAGGYYNASWFLGMNPAAWDRIAPQDQAAIETMSLETVHVLAAKAFDVADYVVRGDMESRGVRIDVAGPESDIWQFVKDRASQYEQEWIGQVDSQGYDAQVALVAMRARRHETGKADDEAEVMNVRD